MMETRHTETIISCLMRVTCLPGTLQLTVAQLSPARANVLWLVSRLHECPQAVVQRAASLNTGTLETGKGDVVKGEYLLFQTSQTEKHDDDIKTYYDVIKAFGRSSCHHSSLLQFNTKMTRQEAEGAIRPQRSCSLMLASETMMNFCC